MCDNLKPVKPLVKTTDLYKCLNIPQRFDCPYMFYGYGVQREKTNPVYATTSSEYGWYTPSAHTVPVRFFPKCSKFSDHLHKCGIYRNYSLNTTMRD